MKAVIGSYIVDVNKKGFIVISLGSNKLPITHHLLFKIVSMLSTSGSVTLNLGSEEGSLIVILHEGQVTIKNTQYNITMPFGTLEAIEQIAHIHNRY